MSTTPELGDTLRRAREAAGWSLHEAAQRLGVSWDSVRKAEEGRDLRLSMLRAWVHALPALSPRSVLGNADVAPPLASPSVWELVSRTHGFVVARRVESARFDAEGRRIEQSEALGVRWLAGHRLDPAARLDLMRTVFMGSGDALRALRAEPTDPRSHRSTIETADAVHEFAFGRHARAAFDYRCARRATPATREPGLQGESDAIVRDAGVVAADIFLPVRELELRLHPPPEVASPSFAFFAVPGSCVPPLGAAALTRALLPDGVPLRWDRTRRCASVTLRLPIPNVRYILACLPADRAPEGFRAARASTRLASLTAHATTHAGRQVEAARERAGLSRRQLATRMDASPASVIELEAGHDPRVSTLRRALRALPGLWPEDLFVGMSRARTRLDLTPREAWLYFRNLVGVEALEASRALKLTRAGDGSETIATRGLRRLHASAPGADMIVQDGISPGARGRLGPVFLEQDGASLPELRVRWLRAVGHSQDFQLVVPAPLAEAGISFTRRDRKQQAYKMRPTDTGRSIGPAYECFVPTSRLILSVGFPRGYRPADVSAHVRAGVQVTTPRWPDLAELLHPRGLELRVDLDAGIVELRVEQPLLGYRYSITWTAP